MNTIDFYKLKEWLQSEGYELEKTEDFSSPYTLNRYTFKNTKTNSEDKYYVYAFPKTGIVATISFGHGPMMLGGVNNVHVDFRKKFWRNLMKQP